MICQLKNDGKIYRKRIKEKTCDDIKNKKKINSNRQNRKERREMNRE
jgi:hypothetical protein